MRRGALLATSLFAFLLVAAPAAFATPCGYTTRVADLNIPDGTFGGGGPGGGGGVTSSFWVPPPDFPGDALTDVNIRVDIQHPEDDQVDISVSHAGKTVSLSTDNGGLNPNYTGTTFDDEAATAVTSGSAPFTGSFRPEQLLSGFDGLPAQGVWTIRVSDDELPLDPGGGGGTPPPQKLLSWGLDYTADQCRFSMPPCDEHGNTFDTSIGMNSTITTSEGTSGTGTVSDIDVFIHRFSASTGTVDFEFGRSGAMTVMRKLASGLTPNLVDTAFSDGGATSGTPPYTGTFAPQETLSMLNGGSGLNAQWRFLVKANGATGAVLGRWGIRVLMSGAGCTDPDNDVIFSTSDNCPDVANLGQENHESDAQGDICDADDDNDTVLDTEDACPKGLRTSDVGGSAPDYDGDGCRNTEDADDDGDNVADAADACALGLKGPGGDTDNDGCKDFEDADDDNDGVADTADICPLAADATQADTDRDGQGDACDADDDGDGVIDGADAFPLDATRTKADVPPPPPPAGPSVAGPKAPPVLSKLKLSPASFAAAKKGASVAAKPKRKAKVGTTITYSADVDSATTFTVTQVTRGTRKGKRCVRPARGLKGKACSLVVAKGSFARAGRAGRVTLKFTGRLRSGKTTKSLAPGSYVLTVRGRNAKGAGKAVTAKFKIVKG